MRVASRADLLHEHLCDPTGAAGGGHSHARFQLAQTTIGLTLILNSFLYGWRFERGSSVAAYSAVAGAFMLGFPIVRVALKDLRSDALNTSVLVAMAVLALFSSGHYQEAGIVSFLMLLGQYIEKCTAECAMAAIRSFIRLNPQRHGAWPAVRKRRSPRMNFPWVTSFEFDRATTGRRKLARPFDRQLLARPPSKRN